eukprot:CAMPEP_0194409602 /NCGR_PEP_ID=MMETSP0176-20130528/7471_1 /TAXON_ID=216777 /ORGANISM="Proboscia alata, Strain PI-D3" /LENGTH=368 /DNA_ID=CAMNT_0039210311 /DNA_START=148 /DNA_END=1254 /DNA_ORIENTATION=-
MGGIILWKFFRGALVAILLKFTTSIDDLIWFSPFLALCDTTEEKLRFCSIYVGVCMLTTVIAVLVASAANYGFDAILSWHDDGEDEVDEYWDASKILCIIAFFFIFGVAIKEFFEWKKEEGNDLPCCCRTTTDSSRTSDGVNDIENFDLNNGQQNQISNSDLEVGATDQSKEPLTSGREDGRIGNGENDEIQSNVHNTGFFLDDSDSPDKVRADDASTGFSLKTIKSKKQRKEDGKDEVDGNGNENQQKLLVEKKDDEQNIATTEDEESISSQILTMDPRQTSTKKLFIVAFCGTLDDMIMFIAVIMGESMLWTSLVVGSITASFAIALLCWQISRFEPLANCVKKVPVWFLFGFLAIYVLIEGLFVY